MQVIADGNNRFAFDLYAQLRQKEGNLFFSPYSAHTALAMTATGAPRQDPRRDAEGPPPPRR